MLLSGLLIIFLIFGLFLSMLSSRPKSDASADVPELPHQREISTQPEIQLEPPGPETELVAGIQA